MTKAKQQERQEAIKDLKKYLKPGTKVYTVLRHCSRSGMLRVIDLYIWKRNEKLRITWGACKATGSTYNIKHEGMTMGGCGMDMGFAAVYHLSSALFPKGFIPAKAGKRYGRNGSDANERDRDGGYALEHEWI